MIHFTKLVMLLFTVTILSSCAVMGQLNTHFYDKSCKNALTIIRTAIKGVVAKEKRMGASLVRMHFHDCFVNGCDGSILLDDNSTFTGEKSAGANANSVRGFEVIDAIKSQLEGVCPGVVSCADILTLAATDSIIELGGPTWIPPLGRRDSTTASLNAANTNIPSPSSSLNTLISAFKAQGLSAKDMIALSGAHTIGQSKCAFFRGRIYNEQNINATFATSLKANCPISGGDNNLANLDVTTPMGFDNAYYNNLKGSMGLLHSDQVLFNGGSADKLVNTYAANQALFFSDFKAAMVKMANIKPLTGRKGQIRKNCRRVN